VDEVLKVALIQDEESPDEKLPGEPAPYNITEVPTVNQPQLAS